MDLYLIRHGQSYTNLPDFDGSDWDQPLTPLGEKQAQALAQWVNKNINARHLYASTLQRTQQTAGFISAATGLEIEAESLIREVGTSIPDGSPLPSHQLLSYDDNIWGTLQPYDQVTPNSESWMQFRTRVGKFIEHLMRSLDNHHPETLSSQAEQTVLVVCHFGVIEACFEYVFAKGPWSVVSVVTHNTGITHLQYRPRPNRPDWRLYYHNRVDHLSPDLIS